MSCKPGFFFRSLPWKKARWQTEKKSRFAGPENFQRFEADLDFSRPWFSEIKVQIKRPNVSLGLEIPLICFILPTKSSVAHCVPGSFWWVSSCSIIDQPHGTYLLHIFTFAISFWLLLRFLRWKWWKDIGTVANNSYRFWADLEPRWPCLGYGWHPWILIQNYMPCILPRFLWTISHNFFIMENSLSYSTFVKTCPFLHSVDQPISTNVE